MISSKEVLVVTTSGLENIKVNKYLQPVSAHVVAGTNVFSDLAASFTDFFGGRSESYQKQLSSLYSEAIERIKIAAFELGANCVLGLNVDIDEISGKDKAMFMITAVGTAVVIEKPDVRTRDEEEDKSENVTVEKLQTLKKKRQIIQESTAPTWTITEQTWDFISVNKVDELFPVILKRYAIILATSAQERPVFYRRLLNYLNNFSDKKKQELVYFRMLHEKDELMSSELLKMIRDLRLLDLTFIHQIIVNDEFANKRKALQVLAFDKSSYNKNDIAQLLQIKADITKSFKELGTRSTKKQLLSSKEKDVWMCECGRENEVGLPGGDFCTKCDKDIWGFKNGEINPLTAIDTIDRKVELISNFLR